MPIRATLRYAFDVSCYAASTLRVRHDMRTAYHYYYFIFSIIIIDHVTNEDNMIINLLFIDYRCAK